MSKKLIRVTKIVTTIDKIEFIFHNLDIKVTDAIEDTLIKPAIRMHIVKIAEQFTKLKEENAFKILEKFDDSTLRGISAVRNFIAHDYDSVDDHIIEDVIRYDLPKIKDICHTILDR